MVQQSDRLTTHHFDSPRLGFFSVAVLGLATLVAVLVILVRDDGPGAVALAAPSVNVESDVASGEGLFVQIVLPGLGTGAPRSLDELSLDPVNGVSRTELTARRYATHLAADIVQAPTVATAPPCIRCV